MPKPTPEQLRNVKLRLPDHVEYTCECGKTITTRPDILVKCNTVGCIKVMEVKNVSKTEVC